MIVIPAVDVMGGRVVRLVRGDPRLATSYESLGDPVAVARRWEGEGAELIHLVDLDAALGKGGGEGLVEEVVRALRVPVQVGGGVRTLDRARALLDLGVRRLVLGSLAFEEPPAVGSLVRDYGKDRVVVALDHQDGAVVARGWRVRVGMTVEEAAEAVSKIGVELVLVTSVERDGTMAGPDLSTLGRLRLAGLGVIAAGGVRGIDDIVSLGRLGLHGVVVGRALYEGAFSLRDAVRAAREAEGEG